MANQFAHIELTTSDLGKAKKFYKKLFDWKLTDMPMGPGSVYTMIAPGKGPGGGMQAQPMPEAPVTWLPYVEVDSVKRSLAKAEKNGAKVDPADDGHRQERHHRDLRRSGGCHARRVVEGEAGEEDREEGEEEVGRRPAGGRWV